MDDEFMYIPNEDTQNYPCSVNNNWWMKCLDTQLNEPTNQNSKKVPKVLKPTNKETLS